MTIAAQAVDCEHERMRRKREHVGYCGILWDNDDVSVRLSHTPHIRAHCPRCWLRIRLAGILAHTVDVSKDTFTYVEDRGIPTPTTHNIVM